MKKYILALLFTAFLLCTASTTNAATSPTPEDKTAEIRDQLITNIASRVAQLKLVERRGIIGEVNDSTNTQITITDSQNNTRFIDVDELTKFSDPTAKGTFGISDIEKGDIIGVLGLYNKESRRILARFVNITSLPTIVHGGITSIDNENYVLNITTEDGKLIAVEVENLTRTNSYTQEDGLIKSGFSKIKENLSIVVTGVLDKKDKNRVIATRIIFFPEIPSSPKVNAASERVKSR